MRNVHRRLGVVATAVMMSVALVGCSDDAVESTGASGSSADSTNGSANGSNDEVAADSPDQETAGTLTAAACLPGTWLADNEFFLAAIQEFGDEIQGVTGDVVVTFGAGGSLQTEYKDWTTTAQSEGINIKMVRTGIDKGTWSANDKQVTIKDTDMTSKLTLSGPGMNMTVESAPANYADASYTCEGDNATITTPDGAMKMTRR